MLSPLVHMNKCILDTLVRGKRTDVGWIPEIGWCHQQMKGERNRDGSKGGIDALSSNRISGSKGHVVTLLPYTEGRRPDTADPEAISS